MEPKATKQRTTLSTSLQLDPTLPKSDFFLIILLGGEGDIEIKTQ